MDTNAQVRWGCVGLGGYARGVCARLREVGHEADSPLRLHAVSEPDHALHADTIKSLRAEGIKVFDRYEDLLAEPVEAVWLPLPIDLHRSFTERALAAGKAVMCEKPAAGSVDDVDAMIAARDRSGLPVAIGFQDIYEPTTLPLKRLLMEGLIGRIEWVALRAVWPRGEHYYERATWAGHFKRGGVWVMDSPAQNALAHFVHLALFLMGPRRDESALPTEVEAELYRANPAIENYDTISARVRVETGAHLLVLLTHAGLELAGPFIDFHGSAGTVRFTRDRFVIKRRGRDDEIIEREQSRSHLAHRFVRHMRGEQDEEIGLATLEMARAHLVAVNGASQAAPIVSPTADALAPTPRDGDIIHAIRGIESIFESCAQGGRTIHESMLADWSRPASRLDLTGYNHFAGPALA